MPQGEQNNRPSFPGAEHQSASFEVYSADQHGAYLDAITHQVQTATTVNQSAPEQSPVIEFRRPDQVEAYETVIASNVVNWRMQRLHDAA